MLDTARLFIVENPLLAAALASLYGAICIDLVAFFSSKEPGSWLKQFDVRVAGWRYAQSFMGVFLGTTVVTPAVVGGAALVALWWLS